MDQQPITRAAPRSSHVRYTGKAFAPARGSYRIGDTASLNLSTRHDSGYAPSPIGRISDLGPIAPLALAALWEVAFAFEAGPLSTWSN
jgi:hypothetical protein